MKYRYRIKYMTKEGIVGRGKPKFTSFRGALKIRQKFTERCKGSGTLFVIEAVAVKDE